MNEISITPGEKLLFLVGLFHGLLVAEGKRWKTSIGTGFRYILLGFFMSQMYLIKQFLDQLPDNAWEIMFSYLYEPVIMACFVVVLMFGAMFMFYTVGAAKVMKSLVD
ncbi:MAG: hypothetical protein ABW092_08065 [Candidatus Thiodiazotropha sp.]